MIVVANQTLWASDNVQMSIGTGDLSATSVQGSLCPQPSPQPSVVLNGNQTTLGTIQLFYTVNAWQFTPGAFACFEIAMAAVHFNGGADGVFPATMSLRQTGSQDLTLTSSSYEANISSTGWSDTVAILVSIPVGVPNDDGTDLVGNLNFSVPGRNKIGTPTSVQVHVRLVWPPECLHLYDFLTDEAKENPVTSPITVRLQGGTVKDTQPYPQMSYNALIVNTCLETISLDARMTLDPRFETSPNGNPGNAVHTYAYSSELDASDWANWFGTYDTETGYQQNLCLQNLSLPPQTSLLVAVHTAINGDLPAGDLGTDPFEFEALLSEAGQLCNPLLVHPLASPSYAGETVSFTTSTIGKK
jgi:hypothetical protein